MLRSVRCVPAYDVVSGDTYLQLDTKKHTHAAKVKEATVQQYFYECKLLIPKRSHSCTLLYPSGIVNVAA